MMLKQIWGYFWAWVRGDDAELHIDQAWSFAWWDMLGIIAIIGVIVWRVWK